MFITLCYKVSKFCIYIGMELNIVSQFVLALTKGVRREDDLFSIALDVGCSLGPVSSGISVHQCNAGFYEPKKKKVEG